MTVKEKSISELQQILIIKKKNLAELNGKKKSLKAQLARVELDIKKLTGTKKRRVSKKARPKVRRKRAGRKNLPQMIAAVLSKAKSPMSLKAITAAVLKAGYTTSSANFSNIVSQVLYTKKEFKKISRGKFNISKSAPRSKKATLKAKRTVKSTRRKKKAVKKPALQTATPVTVSRKS